MRNVLFYFAVPICVLLHGHGAAKAEVITIVAAENVYADIAKQIGAEHVAVISILSNPNQDPHLFEVSPSVAREIGAAGLTISNGIGYDPWMEKLISASPSGNRQHIVVADVAGLQDGANPHLWYDLSIINKFAATLAEKLVALDPSNAETYHQNQQRFEESLVPISSRIAQIAAAKKSTPVAATEPVFGYMLAAMGLDVKEQAFQLAVMNDTEPAISDVATFEKDIKTKAVELLVFNGQAKSPLSEKMLALATANGIAVVEVTETEPPGTNFQSWMKKEVEATAKALGVTL